MYAGEAGLRRSAYRKAYPLNVFPPTFGLARQQSRSRPCTGQEPVSLGGYPNATPTFPSMNARAEIGHPLKGVSIFSNTMRAMTQTAVALLSPHVRGERIEVRGPNRGPVKFLDFQSARYSGTLTPTLSRESAGEGESAKRVRVRL
jgi:hypothetical protein